MKELLDKNIPVSEFFINSISSGKSFAGLYNMTVNVEVSPVPVRNSQVSFQCEEKKATLCLEVASSLGLTTQSFNPGEEFAEGEVYNFHRGLVIKFGNNEDIKKFWREIKKGRSVS